MILFEKNLINTILINTIIIVFFVFVLRILQQWISVSNFKNFITMCDKVKIDFFAEGEGGADNIF